VTMGKINDDDKSSVTLHAYKDHYMLKHKLSSAYGCLVTVIY